MLSYLFCFFSPIVTVDLQVAFALWVASYIGSFFNFLTLAYIGELLNTNKCLLRPLNLARPNMFTFPFYFLLLCRGSS